jgi:hypothetical protein
MVAGLDQAAVSHDDRLDSLVRVGLRQWGLLIRHAETWDLRFVRERLVMFEPYGPGTWS